VTQQQEQGLQQLHRQPSLLRDTSEPQQQQFLLLSLAPCR
jgi:hypothetical protein